jgi:chorismate lyase/3-hydroxybenzoate synthase
VTKHFRSLSLSKVVVDEVIDEERLLGAVSYGVNSHNLQPEPFGVVPIPVLSADDVVHTAWFAKGPFTTGSHGSVKYRYNEHVLFGFVALNEADYLRAGDVDSMQRISQAVYLAIFETIEKTGFRHLVRCWNYLPHINVVDSGMERYRQFNIGRYDAFNAVHRLHQAGFPSACALGTADNRLVVYFLASHIEPQAIENTRQISAYHYPDQYGPRSPTFSRATLLPLPGMEALFVSGTSSITGHETLHHNDIRAQTLETLRNIENVVTQANSQSRLGGFTCKDLSMKVFIRHSEDFEIVADILREQLGDSIDAIWLQADICRSELMVEIEAFGYRDEATE